MSLKNNSQIQFILGKPCLTKLTEISYLTDKKISKIVCGENYTLSLYENGNVYFWGKNKYGIGGYKEHDHNYRELTILRNCKITDIKTFHYFGIALGSSLIINLENSTTKISMVGIPILNEAIHFSDFLVYLDIVSVISDPELPIINLSVHSKSEATENEEEEEEEEENDDNGKKNIGKVEKLHSAESKGQTKVSKKSKKEVQKSLKKSIELDLKKQQAINAEVKYKKPSKLRMFSDEDNSPGKKKGKSKKMEVLPVINEETGESRSITLGTEQSNMLEGQTLKEGVKVINLKIDDLVKLKSNTNEEDKDSKIKQIEQKKSIDDFNLDDDKIIDISILEKCTKEISEEKLDNLYLYKMNDKIVLLNKIYPLHFALQRLILLKKFKPKILIIISVI